MNLLAFHEAIAGYLSADEQGLKLTLAVKSEQPFTAYVRTEPDNEEDLVPMHEASRHGQWHYLTADIAYSEHIEQTLYLFKIVTEDDSFWLGSAGLEAHMPRNIHMFRYVHDRRLPMWSAESVFYQVFPDRFANGDDALSPKNAEYSYLNRVDIIAKQWHELPGSKSGGFEFYGGDLIGVKDKLNYLNDELGITALYLNPVFTSQSSHKYDTVDYFNVDPHFGGNQALESLIGEAHGRNMKVVLDAVINHTSLMHPWFQAAQNGDAQAQARYVFEGDDYGSWKGHKSLPTLDYANPQVVDEMITGDNSVIRHWLRPPYQIDGWRMDVIHMLGEGKGAKNNAQYLTQLRDVIKQENDNALLLGEHFFEASSWLQGDQEDAAMNYFGFAHPARAFFTGLDIALDPIKLSGEDFAKWLREARARISFDHQRLQFNQLDSHDTPRFLTMLQDDSELLKVAIGFLMTYIGTPCLYYGTEVGMKGGNDPDCRRGFPWQVDQWDQDILQHSKRWIELRKTVPSLQSGALVDLYADEHCVVFARVLQGEQSIIAINRSAEQAVEFVSALPPLDGEFNCLEGKAELHQQGDHLSLQLPAKSVTLFQQAAI